MSHKAVLLGINNYKSISDLRGCVNDVRNVQSLLVDVFGFPSQNVRVLTDGEVTKERIRKQWRWMLEGATAGDRLVFHFSGHGSYTADLDEDEPDGTDEILCLWDMDWDNKQSYLLDDELRKFTAQVPAGVFLTVILDSCHSGTATRMLMPPTGTRSLPGPEKTPLVDVATTLARMPASAGTRALSFTAEEAGAAVNRVLTSRDTAQYRQAVLARFVEPPSKVLETLGRVGVRSSFRGRRDESRRDENRRDESRRDEPADVMNHVLLAGSEATQTSADAFIENDFHGAFSYHLCRTIRDAGAELDHQELIRRLRSALSEGRFSQVPQLEPATATGPLLRGRLARPSESSPTAPVGGMPSEGLARELLEVLRDVRDLLRGLSPATLAERAAGPRALVYVHGICRHDAGFSNPWWLALRPHLSAPLRDRLEANRSEVLWSDLVTPPDSGARAAMEPRQAERARELAELLRDVLQDRAQQETLRAVPELAADAVPTSAPCVAERAMLGIPGLDCVDDFVKYLTNDGIRDSVQKRFLDVVVPLLQRGSSIEVVSHSWGTIVAYEALRQLDNSAHPGQVHRLFTVGSALAIVPVQRLLQFRDGRRPRHVQRWINLDARGDIVGGTLRGMPFGVDLEYLNLEPTACNAFLGLVSPACSHSSYFHSRNAAVNRDIFAAQIES